jgi:hypothetical protein
MRMLKRGLAAIAVGTGLLIGNSIAQAGILVGQCIEFGPCYNNTTAWSDSLSFGDLASLGLGTTQNFTAQETSQFVIRLGVTTMSFNTLGGPVVETLGEFSGFASHNDPGPYETDLVGTFFIPLDATSATISGTFGNSAVSSSAGTDLWLGTVGAVPEPETYAMLLAGLGLLGFTLRRRNRKTA